MTSLRTPTLAFAVAFTTGCASMAYSPRSSPLLRVVQVDGRERYQVGDHTYVGARGLAEAVADVPEARAHADEAIADSLSGIVLAVLAVSLVVFGTAATLASTAPGDAFGDGDAVIGPLLLLGGVGATIGSLTAVSSANARKLDAINTFNDVMWDRRQQAAPEHRSDP